MTKKEFIGQSKALGYKSYKKLLVELGYGERCLDRYRYADEVTGRFAKKFAAWSASKGEYPKEQETQSEPDNQKPSPKAEIKKIGESIANKDYHASDNLSASRLIMFLASPVKYFDVYVAKTHKKRYTDALQVGSLHHSLVLEPENFDDDYIVIDGTLKADLVEGIKRLGGEINEQPNSKGELVVKDTVAELNAELDRLRAKEKRNIVNAKQLELAQSTATKALKSVYVIENRSGKVLLEAQLREVLKLDISHIERTFYGEIEGVKFQIKPDLLMNLGKNEPLWFCVDLKTGEDASIDLFTRNVAKHYYDLQQYIYLEVLRQNGINVIDFRFCVTGKSEHSRSAYYQLDRDDVQDAGKVVKKAIEKYKFCRERRLWLDGKFDHDQNRFEPVSTVKLPAWRKHQLIDMGLV